jgi:hypothetical protein
MSWSRRKIGNNTNSLNRYIVIWLESFPYRVGVISRKYHFWLEPGRTRYCVQAGSSKYFVPGSGSRIRSGMLLRCTHFGRTVGTDTLYHSPERPKRIHCVQAGSSKYCMPGSGSRIRSGMLLMCRHFGRTVEPDTLYHSPEPIKCIHCVQARSSNILCPSRAQCSPCIPLPFYLVGLSALIIITTSLA